jgi:hypothetical protein
VAFIVSSLPLPDQAARLQQFVAARGATLSDTAAQNVCWSIELTRPGESKVFGRKLVAALAAHGVVVKYSNALEALAKMCGQANWMRTQQASFEFGDAPPQTPVYVLQVSRDGDTNAGAAPFNSLSDATDRMLALLATQWPTETATALAVLGVGKQMLVVELEHPTAPWLTFRVCRLAKASDEDLSDLPPAEAVAFCERVTRALEYTYPGTLVLNSIRSSTLAPHYYFCPEVHQLKSGDRVTCWADMELLPVLDSFHGKPNATQVDGVLRFDSDDGPIEVTPMWTANTDSRHLRGGLMAGQLNGLLNRLERLRRITGLSVTQHLSRAMSGAQGPLDADDFVRVDGEALEAAMRETNLSAKQLALLAKVSLNVVQRVVKYGYAHEATVPVLSEALGLPHPNSLLPKEKDQGVGLRIEDGATFLRGLKKTHLWRRIVSENLQGDDADEVNRIAEELQEYVEVLQFKVDPANVSPPEFAAELSKPVDEVALARTIQDLLDQLKEMDVAVIVSTDVRYWQTEGRLEGMNGTPMHHGTLFFERIGALQSPRARKTVA